MHRHSNHCEHNSRTYNSYYSLLHCVWLSIISVLHKICSCRKQWHRTHWCVYMCVITLNAFRLWQSTMQHVQKSHSHFCRNRAKWSRQYKIQRNRNAWMEMGWWCEAHPWTMIRVQWKNNKKNLYKYENELRESEQTREREERKKRSDCKNSIRSIATKMLLFEAQKLHTQETHTVCVARIFSLFSRNRILFMHL